jgi:NAD-dependent deacetylase
MMELRLTPEVRRVAGARGRVVVLTGAGISAESGIPTFRGSDGFWTQGSANYTPEEVATWAFFSRDPRAAWGWYLYRRARTLEARPNAAHAALVTLEERLGERFSLVTQNVDGLHGRAGSGPERLFEIHGNLHFMRCAASCDGGRPRPLPSAVAASASAGESLSARSADALHCVHCGGWMRPHVLWFDECYSEELYRATSAQSTFYEAELLVVIGTTGATSLPAVAGRIALRRGIPLLDLNPDQGYFAELARESPGGMVLSGRAASLLPRFVEEFLVLWGGS